VTGTDGFADFECQFAADQLFDDISKRFVVDILFTSNAFKCRIAKYNRPVRTIDLCDDDRFGRAGDQLFQNFSL